MKKTVITLTFVFIFCISLVIGIQSVNMAKANPINVPQVPSVQISYPLTSIGGYVNSTVEFEIYVNMFIESPTLNSISYSLDGQSLGYLEHLEVTNYYDYGPDKIDFKTYTANIILKDLSEGNHTLVAYANEMSSSTGFIVNSHYQITALNVLSPISQIYSNTVPLTFTVNGRIENAKYYLYKGHESVSEESFNGNITLDNLSNGSYDMYVFVTTEYGQDSKALHFYVDSNLMENLAFIVGVIVLLIFSIAIGLLTYFKKHKETK